MAAGLVTVVLEQLATFVQREVQEELALVVSVNEEIEKLTTTFMAIRVVLDDAEEKQVKDKAVKFWLEKLKDVAYDMDDVLDEWSTELLRSQIEARIGKKKKVCPYLLSLCFCFKPVLVRHTIGHSIKEIRKRLDLIANEKDKYNFNSSVRRIEEQEERQMTSSFIDVSEVRGRALDRDIMVNKLLSESSHQKKMGIHVISIVGKAGIGKTTLAQLAFNDERVKSHFEKRMWVCVSDPFDNVSLANAIIEAVDENNVPSFLQWETLQQHLYNSIEGKRFLLVLDDVWTEDGTKWNSLKLSLKGGAQGSRIFVTTCKERVAVMIGTAYTHYLKQLSEKDCWSLFGRIAFADRREEECEKLEGIGKEMQRCASCGKNFREPHALQKNKTRLALYLGK